MKIKFRELVIVKNIKESFINQLLLCIVLCFVVIIGFFVANKVIDDRQYREYSVVEDVNFVSSIDDLLFDDNNIVLSGYAFIANKSSSDSLISMFLVNKNNEQEIWLDLEQVDRPDVNKYYESEYDYTNSGFVATTKVSKLNQNDVYEVYVNIDYKNADNTSKSKIIRTTISTNFFLFNNELLTYHPNEFDKPDMNVESKLLKDVFTNGTLYFYKRDIGMYVYEYQGKLYWIASDDYMFSKEGMTDIIYHLYTTQTNKLPENRIQYGFGNLDIIFENHEYKSEVTIPYRVAIYDIPKEYAITYIKTGKYDYANKIWVWSKLFHIPNLIKNQ